MTVIDRAHRLVLILLVTTIPAIFLVDLVAEILRDDITVSPGWQVYLLLVIIAGYQIATKRWDADWIILGGGLGTAALGLYGYHVTPTAIDLTAAVALVPIVGLVAVAVSRHAPLLTGTALGLTSIVLTTTAFTDEGLKPDDIITKVVAVTIMFGLGGWLLYQLRRGYEEQYAARDRFVATVSHELRTPLTALSGFTEALTDGVVDAGTDEGQSILNLMSDQAREAADIVEDLLVAARTDAGQVNVESVGTRLDHEVGVVLDGLDLDQVDKTVSVSSEQASVLADPLRVRQIVRNLVTNAVRHGGPHITVRTFTSGDCGLVEVSDDGPGFADSDVDVMFKAYGRAAGTSARSGSIGLGLTVSQQLATLMGGAIEVERVDGLTVFRLELPLQG